MTQTPGLLDLTYADYGTGGLRVTLYFGPNGVEPTYYEKTHDADRWMETESLPHPTRERLHKAATSALDELRGKL